MDRRFPFYAWQVVLLSDTPATFVVVAGDDFRWCNGEFRNALEDIFRRIGSKVCSELIVNSEVRCKHKEMPDVPGLE